MRNPLLASLLAAVTAGTALAAIPAHAATTLPATPRPVVYLGNDQYEGLFVADRDTGDVLYEIDGLDHPRAVVTAPDGRTAYAANHNGTTVSVLDPRTNAVAGTVTGLNKPYALAVAPDGRRLFVADDGDHVLAAVDTATRQVTARVTLPGPARGLALSSDGARIYAPIADTDQLAVVDAAGLGLLGLVATGDEPAAVAVSPDGRRAYVPNRLDATLSVIDTATNTVTATVPVGARPAGAAVTPDGRAVYVTNNAAKSVSVVDTATAAVTRTIAVPDSPAEISITPDGRLAQVASDQSHLAWIDLPTGTVTSRPAPYPVTGLAYATAAPYAPTAVLDVGVQDMTVTAGGGWSTPGWFSTLSYVFDFGDGTAPVSEPDGYLQHIYAATGTYTVTLTVTDKYGLSATGVQTATVNRVLDSEVLMTNGNNKFVVLNGLDNVLQGTGTTNGDVVDVVEVDGTTIALRYYGRYVVPGADGTLRATSLQLTPAAYFRSSNNADGSFSLLSVATGKYLSSNYGVQPMAADRATIGAWEKFHRIAKYNARASVRANANGRYVTADNGGNSPLIANRTQAGVWEQFDIVDAGGGYVALFSHANNRFVTAENGGGSPLIANRTDIGPWEKFTLTVGPGGGVTLRALANGNYVTAENGGNAALIANRTAAGIWETFYTAPY
ncbi:PKD domain-containing protein [Dactylosporangium sp. NPDC049140]|uniref:YVTN family beta-propeller repeat protein n=1 Tax=Dactylosporangium sp. NPDC049140 TaxID=3155647 RepID=UPI0033F5B2C6